MGGRPSLPGAERQLSKHSRVGFIRVPRSDRDPKPSDPSLRPASCLGHQRQGFARSSTVICCGGVRMASVSCCAGLVVSLRSSTGTALQTKTRQPRQRPVSVFDRVDTRNQESPTPPPPVAPKPQSTLSCCAMIKSLSEIKVLVVMQEDFRSRLSGDQGLGPQTPEQLTTGNSQRRLLCNKLRPLSNPQGQLEHLLERRWLSLE